MKHQIKLILMDGYGVLMSKGYPDTVDELSRRYHGDKVKTFNILYTKYFNMATERKITQRQAWQRATAELHLPISWQELRDIHYKLLEENPSVLLMIKKLRKRYRVVMLSKNTRSQFAFTRKKLPQVWRAVHGVINTWELNLPKASGGTIKEICRRYKVKPAEILYIDDQYRNLIEAKKMGVATIFYRNFQQFRKELNSHLK